MGGGGRWGGEWLQGDAAGGEDAAAGRLGVSGRPGEWELGGNVLEHSKFQVYAEFRLRCYLKNADIVSSSISV